MEQKTLTPIELVKLKYAAGGSDIEVAVLLGLTRKGFYQLIEDEPDFAKLVDKGRALAEAWWYEQGRLALNKEKFQTALYNFQMKNRYGWADKIDTGEKSNDQPQNLDEATAEFQRMLKRVAKKNPEWLSDLNLNPASDEEKAHD